MPSLGDLPDAGIKPRSPALQADSLQSEPSEKPQEQSYPLPNSEPVLRGSSVKPVSQSPLVLELHPLWTALCEFVVPVDYLGKGLCWAGESEGLKRLFSLLM